MVVRIMADISGHFVSLGHGGVVVRGYLRYDVDDCVVWEVRTVNC